MSTDKETEKSKRGEFLSIGNQYLSFADNLFNKYKTLYNEQQIIAKGKQNFIEFFNHKQCCHNYWNNFDILSHGYCILVL